MEQHVEFLGNYHHLVNRSAVFSFCTVFVSTSEVNIRLFSSLMLCYSMFTLHACCVGAMLLQ